MRTDGGHRVSGHGFELPLLLFQGQLVGPEVSDPWFCLLNCWELGPLGLYLERRTCQRAHLGAWHGAGA